MVVTKLRRRACALGIAGIVVATTVACSSSDNATDTDIGSVGGASTAFVPGAAAPQPPLPPGAGPHGPNPNPTSTPVQDAAPETGAATDSSAPKDAAGQ
jgi:hypothetical protein